VRPLLLACARLTHLTLLHPGTLDWSALDGAPPTMQHLKVYICGPLDDAIWSVLARMPHLTNLSLHESLAISKEVCRFPPALAGKQSSSSFPSLSMFQYSSAVGSVTSEAALACLGGALAAMSALRLVYFRLPASVSAGACKATLECLAKLPSHVAPQLQHLVVEGPTYDRMYDDLLAHLPSILRSRRADPFCVHLRCVGNSDY
jgi:hypothetical protein